LSWPIVIGAVVLALVGIALAVVGFKRQAFVQSGGAAVAGGLLVGIAAILALTQIVQDNERPEPTKQDPQSSLLDRVEYGSR